MFVLKIIYRSLLITGFSFVFSISAFAQSTILVVDTGRVLRDSDVGKHISTQLASIEVLCRLKRKLRLHLWKARESL